MFVVFDLDGTLADLTHRVHHITEKPTDWDLFYELCDGDTVIPPIMNVLHAMVDAEHRVEIWTARSDQVLQKTIEWLAAHDVDVPVRMRARGDTRPDFVVKGEWIDLHGKPDLVFEDRNSVVRHWRERGIQCCQVAEGDF